MKENNCFSYDLDYIREYMENNNINKDLNTNEPIKSLGIFRIDKQENLWKIHMDGPKNTIFKGGFFSLTINFPKDFPNHKPEVRFVNKMYHLQVSPTTGHMDAGFLNKWKTDTTITELLVGIYLFFIVDQNPKNPYSGEMAREYLSDRPSFEQKLIDWVHKYAPPPLNKEDLMLVNMMNDCCVPYEKIAFLEKKYQELELYIINMNNELMTMKSAFLEKDLKIEFYKDKLYKIIRGYKGNEISK
jgi:ubiquitin-protein ligase